MIPPVGKSGPEIISKRLSIVLFGFSIKARHPFIISFRLCGGIFVAIPTAIPDEPFARSNGTLVGKISGIISEPS